MVTKGSRPSSWSNPHYRSYTLYSSEEHQWASSSLLHKPVVLMGSNPEEQWMCGFLLAEAVESRRSVSLQDMRLILPVTCDLWLALWPSSEETAGRDALLDSLTSADCSSAGANHRAQTGHMRSGTLNEDMSGAGVPVSRLMLTGVSTSCIALSSCCSICCKKAKQAGGRDTGGFTLPRCTGAGSCTQATRYIQHY